MNINRIQLGEALLIGTLDQFESVPPEAEIEHKFSCGFEERIRTLTQKSESALWRSWQTPARRAILIAILIITMLVTVACATPVIRNAIIDFIFVEDETAYGITFDAYEAANAPQIIEKYYAPTFEPEGYTLTVQENTYSSVDYLWNNEKNEYIYYKQMVIQQSTPQSVWAAIDAEGTMRTTKNINGYLVEILSDKAKQQYIAVWTDNRYIYTVDISVKGSNQEMLLKAIMDSLVEVETVS